MRLSVCHVSGGTGTIMEIQLTDLPEHKSHGDYATTLVVDRLSTVGDSIHFTRVTDAVNVARDGRITRGELTKAACRITIQVAPGTFKGSVAESPDPTFERYPIVIDVPDITLKGSMVMQVDAGGRATGAALAGDVTTLTASPVLVVEPSLLSQPILIVNGHPEGARGDGAVIEGFLFQTGRIASDTTIGGQGVLSLRVTGLVVRGNRFEGNFSETLDLRATSAIVEKNYLTGRGNTCDICLAGPGEYIARDNRLVGPGGIPGIVSVPATLIPVPSMVEQWTVPAAATVTATITNNEVRNHLARPVGVGIRLGALGIGASSLVGTSKITVTGNTLTNNTFGMLIEAAFPGGPLRGDIDATITGNTISQSCQNNLYVSFTRHTTGLGLNSNQPYLRNTSYSLELGPELPWDNVWYANPTGFGNILSVGGTVMPSGTKHSYDATKICT